ncbi:hypothetical protein BDZ91DRAFT_42566 [Kalaharituber pfeilii]|nr:hypothetical protein BDZ91DRAFT_42566 [Kalaharituber pfeilii]
MKNHDLSGGGLRCRVFSGYRWVVITERSKWVTFGVLCVFLSCSSGFCISYFLSMCSHHSVPPY